MRLLILRTLITNSGITALGLLNSVLLARWLGPVGRGEVAAAMLWPGLLIYISSMGLIVSTMYFTSPPDSKTQVVLNNAILLGLVLSGIAVPISYTLLPWLLKSQTLAVVSSSRLYLAVIPLSLINQFGMGVLQGRLRIKELNWLRTVIPVGYLLGTVSLMALGRLTVMNIVSLHLGLNTIALLCTFATLARSGIYPGFQTDAALAKQMLSYGTRVHVGQISGLANISLDQVLIAAWLPATYLGLYVIAVSSAGLSQLFSGAVQTVTMPGIARKESEAERAAVLQDVFRRYWLLSILIMLAMGAILPVVIPIVFGPAFWPSVWPAEILLIASLFMGAKQVLGGGAVALGNPWLGSKANLIALVVTVVLLSALLPVMGIMGAAIATAAAYSIELGVLIHGLRRTHSISPTNLFKIKFEDLSLALRSMSVKEAPRGI